MEYRHVPDQSRAGTCPVQVVILSGSYSAAGYTTLARGNFQSRFLQRCTSILPLEADHA